MRVGSGLGTLVLDFGSNHETADIRFATDEKLMGVGSNISSYRYSFKSVNIDCCIRVRECDIW